MVWTREAAGDEIFSVRGAFTFIPYPSFFSLFILPQGGEKTNQKLVLNSRLLL